MREHLSFRTDNILWRHRDHLPHSRPSIEDQDSRNPTREA
jgi:hypothetical protein